MLSLFLKQIVSRHENGVTHDINFKPDHTLFQCHSLQTQNNIKIHNHKTSAVLPEAQKLTKVLGSQKVTVYPVEWGCWILRDPV